MEMRFISSHYEHFVHYEFSVYEIWNYENSFLGVLCTRGSLGQSMAFKLFESWARVTNTFYVTTLKHTRVCITETKIYMTVLSFTVCYALWSPLLTNSAACNPPSWLSKALHWSKLSWTSMPVVEVLRLRVGSYLTFLGNAELFSMSLF